MYNMCAEHEAPIWQRYIWSDIAIIGLFLKYTCLRKIIIDNFLTLWLYNPTANFWLLVQNTQRLCFDMIWIKGHTELGDNRIPFTRELLKVLKTENGRERRRKKTQTCHQMHHHKKEDKALIKPEKLIHQSKKAGSDFLSSLPRPPRLPTLPSLRKSFASSTPKTYP